MIVSQSVKINNDLRENACPCCNSDEVFFIGNINYGKNNVSSYSGVNINLTKLPELWGCKDCDSWFTQNRVQISDSIKLYSDGNSWFSKGFEKSKTIETIQLMKSIIKPDCKILDVGCSNGALLDFAKEKKALTYGIEYSKKNRLLIENNGHTAYGDWSEVNDCFDLIVGFDLVEHLYDIKSFLDCCHRHLLKNGLMVILTGNISSFSAQKGKQSWWYLSYPEHIVFPSTKYFSSLSDFELVSLVKTHPYRLSASVLIRSFISSLINPVANSYLPSPLIEADHMLIVLRKR